MTFEEFGIIAKAIRHYFPREKILPDEEAVLLWYEELKDLTYEETAAALRKWVSTNKWSPSIAEIRSMTSEMTYGAIKDWSAAFEDARQAIRRYGSYNPTDALASLDELTRETVNRLGYHDLCVSENLAADRANFRMIYEQLASRKKEDRQISNDVKMMIEQISGNLAIESKEGT